MPQYLALTKIIIGIVLLTFQIISLLIWLKISVLVINYYSPENIILVIKVSRKRLDSLDNENIAKPKKNRQKVKVKFKSKSKKLIKLKKKDPKDVEVKIPE